MITGNVVQVFSAPQIIVSSMVPKNTPITHVTITNTGTNFQTSIKHRYKPKNTMKHQIPTKLVVGDLLYLATKDGVYEQTITDCKYNYYNSSVDDVTRYSLSKPVNSSLPELQYWAYPTDVDTYWSRYDLFYDIKDAYSHSISLNKKTINRKKKTLDKLPNEIQTISDHVTSLEAIAATL